MNREMSTFNDTITFCRVAEGDDSPRVPFIEIGEIIFAYSTSDSDHVGQNASTLFITELHGKGEKILKVEDVIEGM